VAHDVSGTLGRWVDTAVDGVRGDLGAISAIRKGFAGVQDEGSQLIAHVLAGISISGDDSQWLDMCAGPGGKAALLAGLAEARMAHLTALDLQEHRVTLLRDALRHFPSADVHTCDATDLTHLPDYRDGMFDRVLVDAPCSGIGALRRRPDLRWQRDAAAVSGLASLQEALLLAAVKAVRVGGVVGYATCSPHVSETAVVVKQVRRLARQQGIEIEIVNVSDQLSQVPHVRNGSELAMLNGGKPFLQLWPDVHGTDAMFLAILRRVETAHD
jgi:16S rRNA (cytosine967-C5)-methyltransferase